MDKQKRIHTLPTLKEYRDNLRKNLTPAEAILWRSLKSKQLKGRKFMRQHSIGNYIVDFYCSSEKLIIELDGQHHYQPGAPEVDGERDEQLNALGYRVLRFENKRIFQDIESVLALIAQHFID